MTDSSLKGHGFESDRFLPASGVPFPEALEKRGIIPGVKPHLKVYVAWAKAAQAAGGGGSWGNQRAAAGDSWCELGGWPGTGGWCLNLDVFKHVVQHFKGVRVQEGPS